MSIERHILQKNPVCNMSGKGFARVKQLSAHEQTHTKEQPFICDVWKEFC